MINSKRYLHISICLAASFFVLQPALADELINGVKPAVGRANGTIDAKCYEQFSDKSYPRGYDVNVKFWNVGRKGGEQYKTLSMYLRGAGDNKACFLGGIGLTSAFDGGPNGKVDGNGEIWMMRVVNGRSFELTYKGYTASIPIENPEIFDGWIEPTEQESVDPREYTGANFSDLGGQVEINIPDGNGNYDPENWVSAKLVQGGKGFPVGTHIKTFEKSSAIISFPNMSTFQMKPDTEIIISSLRDQRTHFQILAGELWTNIKKIAKDGTMQVEMSQAVAGIKGTTFVTAETGSTSTLKVIEGTVSFTSKATGKTESVSTGEMMAADKNGLGAKTTFDVAKEEADWQAPSKEETKVPAKNYTPYYIGGGIILALILLVIFFLRRKK